MSLRVVVAPNLEDLIGDFLERYWAVEGDVFAPVGVIVPNSATRDWLTEQIASRSAAMGHVNIASNIRFMFPSELMGRRLIASDQNEADESGSALAARIYRIGKTEPDLIPGFAESKRPFRVAQRVARLFDRYASYRPEMLATWSKGKPQALPKQHLWQWNLWNKLGLEPNLGDPIKDADVAHLAKPLFAFGIGEVSPALVQALQFHAAHIDLIIYATSPSPSVLTGAHFPLVAQWGETARASMELLRGAANQFEVLPPKKTDTLLGALQRHVAENVEVPNTPNVDLDHLGPVETDTSIQIHRCHGATRQVEVLRDAILHAMTNDPALTPRDIVVMCPDLDRFASLIDPVLGAAFGDKSLPVVIADRSQKTRAALGLALSDVLNVASGRITSADVLSLIAHPMVQTKFGLEADSVEQINQWVTGLGVRWGINAAHRSASWSEGSAIVTGTWREALDRLLNGIMMQSTELAEGMPGVVLWDDVSGTQIEIIGNLATLLNALESLAGELAVEHTLQEWYKILSHTLDTFIGAEGDQKAQVEDARQTLDDFAKMSEQAGDVTFNALDIIDFVNDQIGNVRSRSAYWWHAVRVGSLVNFKSLPAKVVCILGFDAESLATSGHDGDDLLAMDPQLGDPDPRASQRLHLLNAIEAAQQTLIVVCDGWDVKNNSKVPPAIAMEELVESIEAVKAGAGTGVICDHPRQIADARSFGGSIRLTERFGGAFSFSKPALEAFTEIDAHRGTPATKVFHEHLYPDPPTERSLTVDDLALALNKPYNVFVDRRFDIRLPSKAEVPSEELDLELDDLALHGLGDEYLRAIEAGDIGTKWLELRKLAGELPPGQLGQIEFDAIKNMVTAIHAVANSIRDGVPAEAKPFTNHFTTSGVVVTGNASVHGSCVVSATFGKYRPSRMVAPWFTIASLTLEYPDTNWEAAVVCSNADRNDVEIRRFSLIGEDEAARKENAARIIEFGIQLRSMALMSVLPAGMDQFWPLATGEAKTNVGKAVARLSYEDTYVRLRGEVTMDDLRAESPIQGFDDTLADNLLTADRLDAAGVGYRMRRYAKWMYDIWSSTTEFNGPAKQKKAGK